LVDISYRRYHVHNDYEIFAVISGSAKIRMSTSEFHIKEGSFAVLNSRAGHEVDAEGSQVRAIVIQYSPYFCREYYPHARRMMILNANGSASVDAAKNTEIMSHICSMALHYFGVDRLFELKCIEALAHLLIFIAENLPCEYLNPEQHHNRISKEQKIDTITSYLDSKYQYPVRLDEVAKLVGMTPAYLSHFITKNLGFSFHDYLNNLRFEHALRQIDRDLPLSDISNGSGFSDLKYMTKAFVKNTGLTPTQYRERNQEVKNQERRRSMRETTQFVYSEEQSIQLIHDYLQKNR
jgi:AraC-like DNA-binding protein